MQQRQERIQKAQIEADEKMEEAKGLIVQYDSKIADIDEEKRGILDQAREEAQDKKESLLVDYKKEAENKRTAYLKEIDDEKDHFANNLRKNLGENAVKIASHILDTISSKELEKEVFNTFITNLEHLNESIPDPTELKEADYLDLLSSRDLSKDEKVLIENTLKQQKINFKEINYEIDPDLILGYELNLETYTLHTNIRNYLEQVEKDIMETIAVN
jgi:F-type H+-transporting ATPase subunit b